MEGKCIQSELLHILEKVQEDQEIATAIAFTSEDAAKMFANLANQVILDTTLDLEAGEEDITEKMRHYAARVAQNGSDPNIKVTGSQVTGRLSKELIREIDQRAETLGVESIEPQGPGGRRGKAWMLDL